MSLFGHAYVKPEGLGPRVCCRCQAEEPVAARAARAERDPRQAALLLWGDDV